MTAAVAAPDAVIAFWFPEGDAPSAHEHQRLWQWRLHGGAHHEVVARYAPLTARAAAGELQAWAHSATGRLALTLVLDAFTRAVRSGSAGAWSGGAAALELCLQGLDNGHFQALPRLWHRTAFLWPLEQTECADPARHLAHLDVALAHADRLVEQAPAPLRAWYERSAAQVRRHRAVIARFGRYPHRNALLGRPSTAQELAFIATGDLPPTTLTTAPEHHP